MELIINYDAETQREQYPTLPEGTVKHLRTQFNKHNTCSCGYNGLHVLPIQGYSHKSGWNIEGLDEKVWLFIICPRCDYAWSLWKLGARK